MTTDLRDHKTPSLGELLEGCKQGAVRDYKAEQGDERGVFERLYQSLIDAFEASGKDDLRKDVALAQMLRNLRFTSFPEFEEDLTAIIDHLKRQASLLF